VTSPGSVHLRAPAGEARSETEALEATARLLDLTVEHEILDGGSAARVFRARAEDGAALAVKVLVERPGLVDGHDLAPFLRKLTQIDWARSGEPALGARYVPIAHAVRGDGWAAYTTAFHESRDSAACLRDTGPGGLDTFLRRQVRIVKDLIVYGYGQAIGAAPPDYLATVLAGRFPRRAAMLARALPSQVVAADELVVNGVLCEAPGPLLARLVASPPAWWTRSAPTRLMFPAHGDANTRNILVDLEDDPDGFLLIDPRGDTAFWDPVYDLAKMLFSLTVWDPAIRLGCDARVSPGKPLRVEVGFRHPVFPGYRDAAHRFLPLLESMADLTGLLDGDPFWRDRLLLTHALHVLAEAPCRLSDPKPKVDIAGAECTPRQLALGHYLLGTLLLNDLVARLAGPGEVDVAAHLRLVTDS